MRIRPLTYSAANACSLSMPRASFMKSRSFLYHTAISAAGLCSRGYVSTRSVAPSQRISQQFCSPPISHRAVHEPAPAHGSPSTRFHTSWRGIAGRARAPLASSLCERRPEAPCAQPTVHLPLAQSKIRIPAPADGGGATNSEQRAAC